MMRSPWSESILLKAGRSGKLKRESFHGIVREELLLLPLAASGAR
jgi:hypothetical protein